MRIGTIIAITASSGTPSHAGVMTRLPSTAPTTASERMHAFVDERGRQNVEEHYDDVHDRTTEVCHEQAVEDSGEDTDRNTATRTIGEASHHGRHVRSIELKPGYARKQRELDE